MVDRKKGAWGWGMWRMVDDADDGGGDEGEEAGDDGDNCAVFFFAVISQKMSSAVISLKKTEETRLHRPLCGPQL